MTTAHRLWAGIPALSLLALVASYGVYSFQRLFVPLPIAILSAAAFEATYIGLALMRLHRHDRRRAVVVGWAAVAVSVVYNSLAALIHLRPTLMTIRPLWSDVALAVAHGLPLAVIAYALADMIMHRDASDRLDASDRPAALAPDQAPMPDGMLRDPISRRPIIELMPRVAAQDARWHCPSCRAPIRNAHAYASAMRWGRCAQCAPPRKEASS